MKFNTSWGSIRSGEDESLKIGDDGSRYYGELGAKGLDFPSDAFDAILFIYKRNKN